MMRELSLGYVDPVDPDKLMDYYTTEETNPSKSWTQMEAEAFWGLFSDYEEAGGNGYMHSVVQPAMTELTVRECPKCPNLSGKEA